MEADQATLVMLLQRVAKLNRAAKMKSRCANSAVGPTKNHGTELPTNPQRMIVCRGYRFSRNRLIGGWRKLQICGNAAATPIAHAGHSNAEVTYAKRNGRFGMVRFSIGTLKHASTVEFL